MVSLAHATGLLAPEKFQERPADRCVNVELGSVSPIDIEPYAPST
jgi:hypothetical protein